MAAQALIVFSQGSTIGAAGAALKGTTGSPVTVQNSNNTGIQSWDIVLLYCDPASTLVRQELAHSDNGAIPLATFTPDVRGPYRIQLRVWDVPNRVGVPTDLDIRVFAVPEIFGTVVPPPERWPKPLPTPESGEPGAKPSELNFGQQPDGWAGDGHADGLMNDTLRRLDALFGGGGGGGGTGLPVSNVFVVDGGTSVATPDQTGSWGAPFKTIQAAHTAVPSNSTLLIAGGTYPENLVFTKALTLLAYNTSSGTSGPNTGVQVKSISSSASLALDGITAADVGPGVISATSIAAIRCNAVFSSSGALEIEASTAQGAVGCSTLLARSPTLMGNITASGTAVELYAAKWGVGAASITFSGSAGVLTVDAATDYRWTNITSTLTNGTKTVLLVSSGLADNSVTFAKLQDINTDRLVGRDTAGTGDPEEISVGGGLEFTGLQSIQRSALTGDVTATAGSNTTVISAAAVTNSKLRDSAANSVIGRSATSSGSPADISAGADTVLGRVGTGNLAFTQVQTSMVANQAITFGKIQNVTANRLLGVDTPGPASPGEIAVVGGLEFTGAGGIQRSALTGDVTAAAGSGVTTIAAGAVTNSKLRNSAPLSVIGNSTNTSAAPADISSANDGEVLRRAGTVLGFGTISTAGIGDGQVTLAKLQNISTNTLLGRDTALTGPVEQLSVGGGLEFTGVGGIQRSALTGDVTAAAGSGATTISANAVTDTKLRTGSATSVIGRAAGTSGNVADIQATADNTVLSRVGGILVWAALATTAIADHSVTFVKIQQIPTDTLLGRDAAGTGDVGTISLAGGLQFTGTGGLQIAAFSGDVTSTAGGTALTIANQAVTDAKLRNSAAYSVIGRATGTTGGPTDIAAGANTVLGRNNTNDLAFTQVQTGMIADAAVTDQKFRNSAATSILGRAAATSGSPTDITASADGQVLTRAAGVLQFGTVATAGITDNSVTLAKLQQISTDRLLGRDTTGTGNVELLTATGGLEFTGLGGIQRSALTGDVTASAGSNTTAISVNAVTDAKLRQGVATSIIGRAASTTGNVADIAATADNQVLTRQGGVLVWAALATTVLVDNSVTFVKLQQIPTDTLLGRDALGTGDVQSIALAGGLQFTGSGGLQLSAFSGDVTSTAGGTTLTIASGAVTDAKLRNSAAYSVIGRSSGTAGGPTDIAAGANTVLGRNGTNDLVFTQLQTGMLADAAVTDQKLRNSAATSVLGRAGSINGTPTDIAALADGQVLVRAAGSLQWGTVATAGITDNSVTLAKFQQLSTDTLLGRDTAGTGNVEQLTVSGGLVFTGTGGIQTTAFTGDVTKTLGGTALTISNQAVTYAKIQNVSNTNRFLGRITAGAGSLEELTGTQATTLLDLFSATLKGLVPASGGGTSNYLRADGTFAVPPGNWLAPGAGTDNELAYALSGNLAYASQIKTDGTYLSTGTNPAAVGTFRLSYNTFWSGKGDGTIVAGDVQLFKWGLSGGGIDNSLIWGDGTNCGAIIQNVSATGSYFWNFAGTGRFSFNSGALTWNPIAVTSGAAPVAFTLNAAAHTGLSAGTEPRDVTFNLARTVTLSTGAVTSARAARFQAPTYAFVAASTIGHGATLAVSGAPAGGTNATLTRSSALWLESGGLSLGATPAVVGAAKFTNNTAAQWRNVTGTADTLDIWGIGVDSTDTVLIGDTTGAAGVTLRAKSAGVVGVLIGAAAYSFGSSSFDAASKKITSLANGTSPTDAINLSQLTGYAFSSITIAGDVTGTLGATTVAQVNGAPVTTIGAANTLLGTTDGTHLTYFQLADAQISSTAAISLSKLAGGTALSVLGRSANSAGARADIAGTNNTVLRVSGSVLGFGAIDLSTPQVTGVLPAANQASQTLTGDVGGTTAATVIGANKVLSTMLRTSAALSVVGRSANSTGNVADIAGANNQVLRVSGSVLGFGAIDLSTAQVTGVLPIANQAAQNMSGDVTGTTASSTVTKLQNRNFSSSAPTDGFVPTWDAGTSTWVTTGHDISLPSNSLKFGNAPSSLALINATYAGVGVSILATKDSGGLDQQLLGYSGTTNHFQLGNGTIGTDIYGPGGLWSFGAAAAFPGVELNLASGAFISYSGTHAASGLIRGPNSLAFIVSRTTGGADLVCVKTDSSNTVFLGDPAHAANVQLDVATGGTGIFAINNNTEFTYNSTEFDFLSNNLKFDNTTVAPGAPASGGRFYVINGAPWWISSTGIRTQLAPA